ncbi:MAG: phage tail tube protein [Janthinobacterium lividum]
MGRARGSSALMAGAFETTYGTPPTTGFIALPFVSSNLGEERGLIGSDLLGLGREPQDPTYDVANNDGDVTVPVDVRALGYWLKLLFGAPTTTTVTTLKQHVFTSGALTLPSMSIEIGNPDVPNFSTNYGVRGNQLKIALTRSGLLNAVISCIAQGETVPTATTNAGTAAVVPITRFAQATGTIKRNGAILGSVVGADFTYSNALDKVETIRPDGRIEDADPGMVMLSGSLTTRFKDTTLLTDATGQTPVDLSYGWTNGLFSLIIDAPRVYLPQVKRPVSGPNGIQAQANWQASGGSGHSCTLTLVNDVATYA